MLIVDRISYFKKISLLWRSSIYGIWTWIWYWKLNFLNHVPLPKVMLKIYASVSHPVCRDTQVWCWLFLVVPPNLKLSKKVCKNCHILVIFTLKCAAIFKIKISVPRAQKGREPLVYAIGFWNRCLQGFSTGGHLLLGRQNCLEVVKYW